MNCESFLTFTICCIENQEENNEKNIEFWISLYKEIIVYRVYIYMCHNEFIGNGLSADNGKCH